MPYTGLETRLAELEVSSRTLAAETRVLAGALDSLSAIEREQHELRRQSVLTRRWVNIVAIGGIVVVGVVAVLLYFVLLDRVNTLFNDRANANVAACEARNKGAQELRRRMDALAKAETDPSARRVWVTIRDEFVTAQVDCSKLRPKR